jgi:hypothetical protein
MKIPYGYLEIGTIGYFQPLNPSNSNSESGELLYENGLQISRSMESDVSEYTLYLNGRNTALSYRVLNNSIDILNPYVTLIKQHNERLNNV